MSYLLPSSSFPLEFNKTMGPSKREEEEQSIILISDDEAESTLGSSVLLVDPLGKYCALVADEAL